jgi:arylsulfatase A-like enzyme
VRRHLLLTVPSEALNGRAIPWIQAHANEPFFLFIHYWDAHWPYVPPERYRNCFYDGNDPVDPSNRSLEEFWKHPIGAIAKDTWLRTPQGSVTDANYVAALYDQEIRHLDDSVGELVGALNDFGLDDNTLVVMTGDHGESLTEHRIYFDHYGLYDCTLHVPLILRWPGKLPAGTTMQGTLELTDVAPTLLEAAGLPIPSGMDGHSIWPSLTAKGPEVRRDRVISLECTWQAKWSVRTDQYKLIVARQPDFLGNPMLELYDLAADPGEEQNIAETRPELAASLTEEFEGWLNDRMRTLGKTQDPVREHGLSMTLG